MKHIEAIVTNDGRLRFLDRMAGEDDGERVRTAIQAFPGDAVAIVKLDELKALLAARA